MPSSGLLEGLTVLADNTGLVVGRTLVDPSGWRIPVLVSGDRYGGTVFGDWHGRLGLGHSARHGSALAVVV